MRKVKFVSVFVLLALVLSVGPGAAVAQLPPPKDTLSPTLPGVNDPVGEWTDADYPVGPAAWALGVRAYEVTRSKNELHVAFRHVDKSKQGILRIETLGLGNGTLMELWRSGEALTITWDRGIGEFTLLDTEGRYAHFWVEDLRWVSDDDVSWQVLAENAEDVELVAAIALDFSTGVEPKVGGGCVDTSSRSIESRTVSCDYSVTIRGWSVGDTRSYACWCAKNDANAQCTNSACWGCCDWMSQDCDCVCLVGDYFCSCGITGFPCDVD